MNSNKAQSKRSYASALRVDQANQTRERILDAFAEQLADGGLQDFSIDRVATRAGVSKRTVYHHFPNRDDLFDALNRRMDEQVEVESVLDARDGEDLVRSLSAAFVAFDAFEPIVRAQLVTELGQAARRRGRSTRLPIIQRIVRDAAANRDAKEAGQAAAVIHYLTSSEAWRSMRDESGMSGKQAGEAVSWAIRCLLATLGDQDKMKIESNEESRDDQR